MPTLFEEWEVLQTEVRHMDAIPSSGSPWELAPLHGY